MPPRRAPRHPKDLVVGLPGGDDISALGQGFATQNLHRLAERSNQLLVGDTVNAYIVLDARQNGPLARSIDMATLRREYAGDLALGGLTAALTDDQFRHQLDTNKLGIARRQSVFEGVPTTHHWRPTNRAGKQADIWIARSKQAKNALPNRYDPLQIRY